MAMTPIEHEQYSKNVGHYNGHDADDQEDPGY